MKFVCIYRCGQQNHVEVDHPYGDRVWNNPAPCAACVGKAKEKRTAAASRRKKEKQ